ncbi:hypothetical protein B0A50_00155 [Salinomyces thailandicus]|uniref:Uncharacterized protein n=1 Tax=Salinomyces thailandicus TaxID=706561 RepID=A0A4U0UHW6_9PEZI|nr:hypothetical protein B0A50_00155 [Salinomyces thailandica]
MFARVRGHRHERSSSGATTASAANANQTATAAPLVSPLSPNFTFDLPPSGVRPYSLHGISGEGLPRPGTSDGLSAATSHRTTGLRLTSASTAPVLPPIPRVASRYEPDRSARARDDVGDASTLNTGDRGSRRSTGRLLSGFEQPVDIMPTSAPASPGDSGADMQPLRPLTPDGATSPMGSTLFPPKHQGSPHLSGVSSGPPMSRSFVDSRDKPYSQAVSRPLPMQQSHSMPHILETHMTVPVRSPPSLESFSAQGPMSPQTPTSPSGNSLRAPKISGARLSPNSSVDDLKALHRAHTNASMPAANAHAHSSLAQSPQVPRTYSGSTEFPSTLSSVDNASSPSSQSQLSNTVGTPYQTTASTFPLPRHVATRPKTQGGSAMLAGVTVPTHHTSTPRPESAGGMSKADKRKSRLLNPMALLTRRKSGQEGLETPADRSTAAQAYARQKSVAKAGVSKLPEDFDPRIRGKVVHDFSAPKSGRNVSYNDADVRSPDSEMQAASMSPSVPVLLPDFSISQQSPTPSQHASEGSSSLNRRSAHSPSMFREIFANDDDDATKRASSLNAERLENRDFLQRVGHQSSNSAYSQESTVLPPFARRSQILDPMQASFFQDNDSKRSSDPSSGRERDSNLSSTSCVSPITARSSAPNASDLRHSASYGMSPVSPSSPAVKGKGLVSGVSDAWPATIRSSASPEPSGKDESEATPTQPYSIAGAAIQPAFSPIAEQPQDPSSVGAPHRNPGVAPEVVLVPERESSPRLQALRSTTRSRKPSVVTTPEATPEVVQAETVNVVASKSPHKLVEKRASAVGHSRRLSGVPKHHASNASRFSFQLGESAAEEQALEDKHRKVKGQSGELQRQLSPDEDEDEFDEGAMDDMDELELSNQEVREAEHDAPLATPSGGLLQLQQARQHLQVAPSISDDASFYDEDHIPDVTDEHELTYADHPAFRAHPAMAYDHSRNVSQQTNNYRQSGIDNYMLGASEASYENIQTHQRMLSDASGLIDVTRNSSAADSLASHSIYTHGGVEEAKPRSGFYMQPQATGYLPQTERHDLPQRRSGDGDMRSAAGGFNVDTTASASISTRDRMQSQSTGLGLSGFDDFDFGSGPDLSIRDSRPTSRQAVPDATTVDYRKRESMPLPKRVSPWEDLPTRKPPTPDAAGQLPLPRNVGQSAAYGGAIGKDLRARNAAYNQNLQYAKSDSDGDGDDMYYDDGGFEQDIESSRSQSQHDGFNEDALDSDTFMRGHVGAGHQRQSGMSFNSLGSDGPYPSFAMGVNPLKARQRQSQLLLENLPLQGPVDPKLIPQRNPSEDAKRLGLSTRVPPLPAQQGSKEAMDRMQSNLHAYHASLAEAANRAAMEGRFLRQPSTASTATRSESSYSNSGEDDRSRYSGEENVESHSGIEPKSSDAASHNTVEQRRSYSPLRLNFDFGFNALASEGSFNDDDLGIDDDIVAAANGDVLASDDAAFYGQEFGFYAKARPSSDEAEAIHGGFFGEDGDNGLSRNKSLREPNLTPITERSEFSTRNSLINLGHGGAFGLPSAGLHGPASPALARLPVVENEITSFDQLRKLRASAFGGSTTSLQNEYGPMKGPGSHGWHGAPSPQSDGSVQGYFASVPMALGYSTDSNSSSNPSSAQPHGDSPQRRDFSNSPSSGVADAGVTPRKQPPTPADPETARKVSRGAFHSRQGSDHVTVQYSKRVLAKEEF